MGAALSLPVIEAVTFTTGCVLIYAQRRHAGRITRVLMLMLYVVTMALALEWGLDRAVAEPGATDLSAAFTGISE
ncbi:hypothetical protein [Methylobacterium nigriterrae]|uniref:hypothetical protein n=1 Tax=Methylobacterium nigriterrae TaxID=3127512 RepID=UPI003013404F